VQRSGKSLAELLGNVKLFPQEMINVRLKPGQDWKANPKLAEVQKAVEAELGNTGRVLIRASGTEPVVRVMVEARKSEDAKKFAERIAMSLTI
jgi:phosphoglucosamine mutase